MQKQTLGAVMHDAGLESIESLEVEGMVRLVVESDELIQHYGLPDTERLVLQMEGVTFVRCALRRKEGREESVDWSRAETMARRDEGLVFDAWLLRDEASVTLDLTLYTGPDEVPEGYTTEWHLEIAASGLRLFLHEANREISLETALLEGSL